LVLNKEIVSRLRNSDPKALRELFDCFSKKIYYYAFGYLKNKSLADEVVQEVFVKIWDNRFNLSDEKSIEGLIKTIAYHRIVDCFREERKNVSLDGFREESRTLRAPIEEDIFYAEAELLYQDALSQLSERKREIYLLSRQEGLTYQQIADRHQISLKTVETHMTDALRLLREHFKKANSLPYIALFIELM
jgi:RNA polymerase sigma-70 factor, ECF subfamily